MMIKSKLILSLRPCTLISIVTVLMVVIISTHSDVSNNRHTKIIQDLPGPNDIGYYLAILEKTVHFCTKYKHYVDINLKFGLFLIDVNLKVLTQQRRKAIPQNTLSRLEKLFEQNDEVTKYFLSMAQQAFENDPDSEQNVKLALLFNNVTMWSRPPEALNTDLLKQTEIFDTTQLKEIYDTWQNYVKKVEDYQQNKPTPIQIDECIGKLALTYPLTLPGRSLRNCLTSTNCKAVMRGGNKFGYGLTHRLLFMTIAHFPRQCVVFSREEDKNKTDTYCKKCFNEAEYIALNTFQLPDLMCEQIALCGLFGHAQFVRNYWIKTLLQFQTSEGCFSEDIASAYINVNNINEANEWKLQRPFGIMNGQCSSHFTGVAAASTATALRYIIERYF